MNSTSLPSPQPDGLPDFSQSLRPSSTWAGWLAGLVGALVLTAAPPELPVIPNQIITQGAPPLIVPFTLPTPTPQSVWFSVTGFPPELSYAVEILGTDTDRRLRIPTPPLGRIGNVILTLLAYDREATNRTSFVLTIQPREFGPSTSPTLPSLNSASWADFTSDGYPDLLSYRRTRNTLFPQQNSAGRELSSLPMLPPNAPTAVHTVAWTDFDGDGALEVLAVGFNQASLFRTEARGHHRFIEITNAWPFQYFAGAAWGDFDGDGDEDLVMTGRSPEGQPLPVALLRNERGTELVPMSSTLPASRERPVIGDFDNDGRPDVLLFNVGGSTEGGVWLNQGNGTFIPSLLTLATDDPGSRLDWIHSAGALDFDGDGRLDVWAVQESPRSLRNHELLLWRQRSGRLELHLKLEPEDIRNADAPAWADFDADGRLDFVLPRLGPELFLSADSRGYQRTNYFALHRNLGDGRFLPGGYLFPAAAGTPAAGDFNRDGLMDLWAPGTLDTPGRVFTNALRVVNPPPEAPLKLQAWAFDAQVFFFWNEAHDPNQTVPLTYNLRVGTRPGANDVVPSLSLANGTRLLPAPGNNGFNTFRLLTLERVPSDRLFWSVQAVDNGFLGSPWAPEQDVALHGFVNEPPVVSGVTNVMMSEDRTYSLSFTVTDDHSPPEMISVRVESSDPEILPVPAGELPIYRDWWPLLDRLVSLRPRSNRHGQVVITIIATDPHGATTSHPFTVTITPVNDLPELSFFPEYVGLTGQPLRPIVVRLSDVETSAGDLTLSVTSSHPETVDPSQVVISGSGPVRTLTVTPASANPGVAHLTLRVEDGDGGVSFGVVRVAFQEQVFTPLENILPGIEGGQFVWGDYDRDGDLDLVLVPGGGGAVQLFTNEGGRWTATTHSWPFSRHISQAIWGDADGDGDLDLLLVGVDPSTQRPLLVLNWNHGGEWAGELLFDHHHLLLNSYDWAALVDVDRDGDLDVLQVGFHYPKESLRHFYLRLWRNTAGRFQAEDHLLAEESPLDAGILGPVLTADFDQDGFTDWAITRGSRMDTELFRNEGGTHFTSETVWASGRASEFLAVADFDLDGLPDIYGVFDQQHRVAQNLGGFLFTNSPPVPANTLMTAAGDLNNDGFPDLADVASDGVLTVLLQDPGFTWRELLTGVAHCLTRPTLGDVDGDGDLDLVVAANLPAPWPPFEAGIHSLILRNDSPRTNRPPTRPWQLAAARIRPGTYRFSWGFAADRQQPRGLTYNLRVGTAPGANDVVPSQSLPNNGSLTRPEARRLVPAPGNAGGALQFVLDGVPEGRTLYWSVQAVDGAFVGGEFADEQVLITGEAPLLSGLSNVNFAVPFPTNTLYLLPFTVTDTTTPTRPLQFRVTVSNPGLFGPEGIQVTGFGAERLLRLPIRAGQAGRTEIVVRATNANGAAGEALFAAEIGEGPSLGIRTQAGSASTMQVRVAPGLRMRLERSPNLAEWEFVAVVVGNATGEIHWPVPPAEQVGPTFYRLSPAD